MKQLDEEWIKAICFNCKENTLCKLLQFTNNNGWRIDLYVCGKQCAEKTEKTCNNI